MSNMLEQAIIDADALREAALKSAQSSIMEKYSEEIRNAVDSLLEVEDPEEEEEGFAAAEPSDDPGFETPEPSKEEKEFTAQLPSAHLDPAGKGQITIDFDALEEMMSADDEILASELQDREDVAENALPDPEEVEFDLVEEEPVAEPDEGTENLEESIDITREELAGIIQELTLDLKNRPVPHGQAGGGTNNAHEQEVYDMVKAQEAVEELEEDEDEELKEASEAIENLQKENQELKALLVGLNDKLNEVNISNAKLLYTNRVLSSTSLNERQKEKIAEAISKAESVEESKIIYESIERLQGTVGRRQRNPKSLSEAVSRSSSTMLPRKREAQVKNSISDRWKALAGIKK